MMRFNLLSCKKYVISQKDNLAKHTMSKKKHLGEVLRRVVNSAASFTHKSPNTKPSQKLQDLVKSSSVVIGSNASATSAFRNDPKFNKIVYQAAPEKNLTLINDKRAISNGNLAPLVGQGIISSNVRNSDMPISINYVCLDKNTQKVMLDTKSTDFGMNFFRGDDAQSAELIPGLPFGNYYNQQKFDNNLHVLTVNNGERGTIGCQINLAKIEEGYPLLINGGKLSGCTMVYAVKGNSLFIYHAGKSGNDASDWKTGSDGVRSIIDAHSALTSLKNDPLDSRADNQGLVNYLESHFDFYSLTYCGHGEAVEGGENVFDYNQDRATTDDNVRVGNAMALIVKHNGIIKIQTMSDDMTIDKKNVETQSVAHRIGQCVVENG
ncbi:hypothetical protein NTJ19_000868 [Yersinia ruckeri]|nr:hypothetical protein [Yersinia ruckeri]EKN4204049.1 hypothetical protein [Yersinia ruckeri]EKN4701209.1 hypothetical protein [Yersinia ruckeri]